MVFPRKFGVVASVMLLAVLTLCAVAVAQPGAGGRRGQRGQGGPQGFRGGFGGFGSSPLQLIQREDVEKELKLTASQTDQLAKLAEDQQGQGRGRFGAGGGGRAGRGGGGQDAGGRGGRGGGMSAEERQEAFARMREERAQEEQKLREDINGILNRTQQTRFAELEFQFNLERGRLTGALEAAGIKLSDAEMEKLTEAQRDAQQELQQKIAALQREVQMEALATVVSKDKIDRAMGDEFTFDADAGRGAFGRRGGGGPPADNNSQGNARSRSRGDNNSSESQPDSSSSRRRRRGT